MRLSPLIRIEQISGCYLFPSRLAAALIEALFPPKCMACGTFFPLSSGRKNHLSILNSNLHDAGSEPLFLPNIGRIFNEAMSPFLCASCLNAFSPLTSPFCSKCGYIFKSREGEDHVCQECLDSPKRFGIARSAGIYDRSLRSVIHQFKYRGKIQLAIPFGKLLFSAFVSFFGQHPVDIVVPVPLHIKRFRSRGFNQALLLVRNWENDNIRSQKILSSFPRIEKNLLVRNRHTPSQTGLDKKSRISNIKDAFALSRSRSVEGKRILLIDDVYTTGATVNECAMVLLNAGAESVDVLTLARAVV